MEEPENKLKAIPDSYFGFVVGIITYVKQKPGQLIKLYTLFLYIYTQLCYNDFVSINATSNLRKEW